MNKNILFFICLFLFEKKIQTTDLVPGPDSSKKVFYLPMKKDHKYGDDICYYRQEIDEKHDYIVYYVKPCEKGRYCETEVENQPFGFCRDVPTNAIDFPTYEGDCTSNGECPNNLFCDGKCKSDCSDSQISFLSDIDSFCKPSGTKTNDDGKHCRMYSYRIGNNDPKQIESSETTYGKYPGLPKQCGIIRYKDYTLSYLPNGGSTFKSYTKWEKESEEWCTIGEAEDGDFVKHWKYCKSGFTLRFFPKGDLVDPSIEDVINPSTTPVYHQDPIEMCVTPIQIDKSNPEVGTIVTYKIKDGDEHKYNYYRYYDYNVEDSDGNVVGHNVLNDEDIIKSQIYTQFSEEFKNANDEDKKSCYEIPDDNVGNCQNIKLLKLYYFYKNTKEYLFYKDRKDLEKVLHFKIQNKYHRYYEFSSYLNFNYLFLLLILILL